MKINVWGWLRELVEPVTDLVSEAILDKDKAAELKAQIFGMQLAFSTKLMEYEAKLLELRASIINTESTGHSWLQRNWRPITMLTFLFLVVMDSFGVLATALAPEAWTLLQIGLGGYVTGRSIEKIVPSVVEALGKRGKNNEA